MKKLILFFAVFMALQLQAQGHKLSEKKEKIKAFKTAYLTAELQLTEEESKKFWPIYNAYDDKMREIKHERVKRYLDANENNLAELSAKDAADLLAKVEQAEEIAHQERKKFVQNLKAFLPALKILQLKKAEESFNRKLLQHVRNRKK
jgi:hypothetical protein